MPYYVKKGGKYKDSACTEEDFKEKSGVKTYKGKYEKTGGAKFTGVGGAGTLEAAPYGCQKIHEGFLGEEPMTPHEDCMGELGFTGIGVTPFVECVTEHASGEADGSNEVANVSVLFTGCTFFGDPATTKGLAAGEIRVNTLKGHLGYISAAKHEVGVLLEPATSKGLFAEFEVLNGVNDFRVGEGNATEGAFYEQAHGTPTGNDGVISRSRRSTR